MNKNSKVEVPTGIGLSLDRPANSAEIDENLITTGLKAVAGSFASLNLCVSDESRKEYSLKFVAGLVALSETLARAILLSKRMENTNFSDMVDQLIKSLSKRDESH